MFLISFFFFYIVYIYIYISLIFLSFGLRWIDRIFSEFSNNCSKKKRFVPFVLIDRFVAIIAESFEAVESNCHQMFINNLFI